MAHKFYMIFCTNECGDAPVLSDDYMLYDSLEEAETNARLMAIEDEAEDEYIVCEIVPHMQFIRQCVALEHPMMGW